MDYIDSFLHNLKIIIKETSALLPNDPLLYRVNKRITLAIQYDPLLVFNKVGEYLYKYRNFVYDATTERLLLEWDFTETEKIEPEKEDIIKLIISQLKKCLISMDDDGRKFFRKLTCSLLDDYLEYKYIENSNKKNI